MNNDFIIQFIKGIFDVSKGVREVYNWEPIYYKGFHLSGPKMKSTYHGFNNLKYRGIIKEVDKGKYEFTNRGKVWFRGALLKYYKDLGIKWDRKWRIVIFDVPQEFHNKRNRLRRRLSSLGFYMLQKSIFAFPYPCEEEITEYCSRLGISDYVNIITAENLGYIEDEVKKFFQI